MENNETYFKMLLNRIEELSNENLLLKQALEESKKPKQPNITSADLDGIFDDLFEEDKDLKPNKVGVKNETKYRR